MEPVFFSPSVVLLGAFNPDDFHPDKLSQEKIITQADFEEVQYRLIVPGRALQFDLPWSKILIGKDRFQVEAIEAPYIRVSDFVAKALIDLDIKYAVTAVGLNAESHFDLLSVEARDQLGTKIAPPKAWASWGSVIAANMHGTREENPIHGGLVTMQMRQPFLDVEKGINGWLDVTLGLSGRLPQTGVMLRSNKHYQVYAPKDGDKTIAGKQESTSKGEEEVVSKERIEANSKKLLEIMQQNFDSTRREVETIFKEVVTK
jgi:hypothetical protein